jgi:hypothetical protein
MEIMLCKALSDWDSLLIHFYSDTKITTFEKLPTLLHVTGTALSLLRRAVRISEASKCETG